MRERPVLRSDTRRDRAARPAPRLYGSVWQHVTLTYDYCIPPICVRGGGRPPERLAMQFMRVLQMYEVLCHRCALGLEPAMPDLRGDDWPDDAMILRYELWCERLTSDHALHQRWVGRSSEWLQRYCSCFRGLLAMERELCGDFQCGRYHEQLLLTCRIFRVAMATPSLVPHIDPLPNLPNYVYPDPRYL